MTGTIVRGRIIRGDLAQWDGKTATASRLDATGGTVTGLALGNEVDVLQVYGSGTSRTRGAADAAIRFIGTTKCTLVFAPGTWTIDDNLTIGSNFTCHVPAGCIFDVSNGKTLTFSGEVHVENPGNWTSGSGSVVVSLEGAHGAVWHRTAAERSAGVTPSNLKYPPGDVRRYGATGDGSTDDTSAFTNALLAYSGLTIYVPPPATAYKVTSTLTVPDNTTIRGENKRTCKILAGGNIDIFALGDGAQLHNLYVEGNATTGRAVTIASGKGNQTIAHCRFINFDCGTSNGVIHFSANDAGSRISVHDVEVWQTNGNTGNGKYAVFVPDVFLDSATPRKFSHIETSGFCSFSFGGSNDFFISNSFIADLAYSSNTRAVQIVATRIANQTALTVSGANHCIIGCDVNPTITISSGSDNITIGPNSYNNLPITDSSGNARNNITHWKQSYTPSLTAGGTAPSLGNGTLTGFYTREGAKISFVINFTVGSTTTLGTGDIRFSLPITRSNTDILEGANFVGNRGGTNYTAVGQIPGAVSYVTFIRDTSGSITFNSPASWASGDTMRISGSYYL